MASMMCLRASCLVLMFTMAGAKNVRPSELMADPCQCVPPHMCIDNDLALNGQGSLDIRVIDGECENMQHVCCDNVIKLPETSSVPSVVQSIFNSCGFETPLSPRVLGKQTIIFGEVPWTTALLMKDQDTKRKIFLCGSSLIHPQVVLTAAHCISNIDTTTLTVRAGEVDSEDTVQILPHQDRSIKEVVIHKGFDSRSLKNDIALIFLTEPFMLSGNVRTVCLPNAYLKTIGNTCFASGWGSDSFASGKHSTVLKRINLPLISRSECLPKLRSTRLGPFFRLHRSFICAGGEKGKDTCTGDGGSPLVCPMDGQPKRFVQMGIVSWGIGCGGEFPAVYVNVNLFSQWIDHQMLKRRMDINIYKYN